MIAASLPDRRQVEFGESVVTDQRPSAPPPRVRGKRSCKTTRLSFRGSIPACAGETMAAGPPSDPAAVHPRVCGGNIRDQCALAGVAGPSPRVRGKLSGPAARAREHRSIPACAGETFWAGCEGARTQVHPRVCGGNPSITGFREPTKGPSPRVRGKPVDHRL